MNWKHLALLTLMAVAVLCRDRLSYANTPVESPSFQSAYSQSEHYFSQIVDHYNYANISTWKQRYFAVENFFNPNAGPVFLFICGEYVCPGIPDGRQWAVVLAEKTQGLVLVLEHRYYGKSMPFGDDSLSDKNLGLLNTEQALKDLAYFIQQVKERHLHKVENNPWITIGGSYPGAMSAWFRYKYPHLTIGAIASSAVVNAIQDFKEFDNQVYLSSSKSGSFCSDAIAKVTDYVEQQMTSPNAPSFRAQFRAEKLSPRQFMFYWADVTVQLIQYGKRTTLCSNLKGKTLDKQYEYIKSEALKVDPYQYGSYYLRNETFAMENGAGARSWYYQVCTEFGWLQTFSQPHPMRSKLLTIEFFRKWCEDSYGPGMYPKIAWSNTEFGGLESTATNLLMSNGVQDPWIWASMTKSHGGITSEVATCDNCAHCVDLHTPSSKDSPKLTKIRNNQYLQIKKWIQHYWKSQSKKATRYLVSQQF